ncbi:MAG: heat-inducible transcription repressor HrcA [Clostridiaceae bacterium]|nr:heat-inducible transcription repressor HrcA [Clostridiaceae bacterium]
MVWEKELNERKRTILKSIIDDYIKYAQPVGSRTIARKLELGLGSATIRNEMADLEELGYITQPYTSAGRIPSDKGYRFYVEHLMQLHSLAYEEMEKIQAAMSEQIEEINELIKKVSIIISNITGYTSFVLSPQLKKVTIKTIRLIYVDEKMLLLVVVANGGIVKDKIVKHQSNLDEDTVHRLSNFLNKVFSGKTVVELSEQNFLDIQLNLKVPKEAVKIILEAIEDCIRKIDTIDVYLDGVTNILNFPEFSDLLKAREILELLKEEEVVINLVKNPPPGSNLDYKIGSENELNELKELSVITTVYGSDGKNLGTFGVIGPTRMAYGKVVSSIKYIREVLNKELLKILGDDSL